MDEQLRIAQLAPLTESVPPSLYGGTERVVSYLTEELVRRGHEVTLFASGDSRTRAKLVAGSERALRLNGGIDVPTALELVHMESVMKHEEDFDVIHSHLDIMFYPFARRLETPCVSTLHGRLDLRELNALYREYEDINVVSISQAQRRPIDRANWVGNIYHGLPLDLYDYRPDGGEYLAFLGRISPEKRVDSAIEVARRAGIPLKIAAKVDPVDQAYFDSQIKPLLDHELVEFIGEINEEEKNEFLGEALALIFMIDWPEPFGLAMIEAMACGTPTIARRRGSVPEVIDEGASGFIVEDVDDAVEAARRVQDLDRHQVRQTFERRYSVERMVDDYLEVYRRLVKPRAWAVRRSSTDGGRPAEGRPS